MRPIAEMSPRFKAGIAGLLYLIIFITAPSGAASAIAGENVYKSRIRYRRGPFLSPV
jgi:hypothetical protein